MRIWDDKRVLVTGWADSLRSYVAEKLKARGSRHVYVSRCRAYDLRQQAVIQRLLKDAEPDMVIHLAATVGGIGIN